MFDRIIYADWHVVFPVIAFLAAATFFTVMSWRALRMKRTDVERLARLPLQDDAARSADGRSGFIPDVSGVKPDLPQRASSDRVHPTELRFAGPVFRHE